MTELLSKSNATQVEARTGQQNNDPLNYTKLPDTKNRHTIVLCIISGVPIYWTATAGTP